MIWKRIAFYWKSNCKLFDYQIRNYKFVKSNRHTISLSLHWYLEIPYYIISCWPNCRKRKNAKSNFTRKRPVWTVAVMIVWSVIRPSVDVRAAAVNEAVWVNSNWTAHWPRRTTRRRTTNIRTVRKLAQQRRMINRSKSRQISHLKWNLNEDRFCCRIKWRRRKCRLVHRHRNCCGRETCSTATNAIRNRNRRTRWSSSSPIRWETMSSTRRSRSRTRRLVSRRSVCCWRSSRWSIAIRICSIWRWRSSFERTAYRFEALYAWTTKRVRPSWKRAIRMTKFDF